jgi:hypothetical protein
VTAPAEHWWRPGRPADLDGLLWHRRWWRHSRPFPHVRAVNVFVPAVYQALVEDFRQWQRSTGGGAPLPGHDLSGATVTRAWTGPLRLFTSRGWCDLVAGATGTTGLTRHVNVGLHRHEPHSSPGFPHTDLNPGWFPRAAGDAIVLADPHRVEYTTGTTRDGGRPARPVVRAVAVLFYLANPPWRADHDGRTGLYRSGRDDPAEPAAAVPPHSNSLLAFECTPWSFHGFTGGGSVPRNSVVQWLHRPRKAVESRWGPDAVVGYGEAER